MSRFDRLVEAYRRSLIGESADEGMKLFSDLKEDELGSFDFVKQVLDPLIELSKAVPAGDYKLGLDGRSGQVQILDSRLQELEVADKWQGDANSAKSELEDLHFKDFQEALSLVLRRLVDEAAYMARLKKWSWAEAMLSVVADGDMKRRRRDSEGDRRISLQPDETDRRSSTVRLIWSVGEAEA